MYQKIKDLQLKARKEKSNLVPLYTTLLGELQKAEKNGQSIDNAKVVATLKSFSESASEMIKHGSETASIEYAALVALIPAQMTGDQIEAAIRGSGAANLGQAMKFLKENHAGLYDGKQAQEITKGIFK